MYACVCCNEKDQYQLVNYLRMYVCNYLLMYVVCMYVNRKSVDDDVGTYVTGHMLANSPGRTH